jgi:hypothetical protein
MSSSVAATTLVVVPASDMPLNPEPSSVGFSRRSHAARSRMIWQCLFLHHFSHANLLLSVPQTRVLRQHTMNYI